MHKHVFQKFIPKYTALFANCSNHIDRFACLQVALKSCSNYNTLCKIIAVVLSIISTYIALLACMFLFTLRQYLHETKLTVITMNCSIAWNNGLPGRELDRHLTIVL